MNGDQMRSSYEVGCWVIGDTSEREEERERWKWGGGRWNEMNVDSGMYALRSLVISGMTYETLRSIWEQHLLLSLYFVFVFSLKHVHMVQMTDTTLLNGHQPKHMISNNSALKRRTTILVVSHPRCFLFLLLCFLSLCYFKLKRWLSWYQIFATRLSWSK